MDSNSISFAIGQRIFRSVRAAIVYERSVVKSAEKFSLESLYSPINVRLISSEELPSILGDEFDVIGVLGQSTLESVKTYLEDFPCLKIGFYPQDWLVSSFDHRRASLRYITAAVACLGSSSLFDLLRTTVFHFYESLTLPSLLNIDLADVESIAHGVGVSFNVSGDSSGEIIGGLPPQCYISRSALLHFTCKRDVTLEEVYRISKMISTRNAPEPFISDDPNDHIKMYKRIRLKMGLRISPSGEGSFEGKVPRISLTGILFGLREFQISFFRP